MTLFDDFTKKAARFTEDALDKTQELADSAKTQLKIKNLESQCEDVFNELGHYYYDTLQGHEALDEEVHLMCQKIEKINEQIEELKNASYDK